MGKKYALYTKYPNENRSYISSINIGSLAEAKAYFIGMKRLTEELFDQQFQVDLIQEQGKGQGSKGLLFGNR
tara:strand:+ start:683 stop:898 length:216 start_codon:yes stop_codon:yes gene_type:complete